MSKVTTSQFKDRDSQSQAQEKNLVLAMESLREDLNKTLKKNGYKNYTIFIEKGISGEEITDYLYFRLTQCGNNIPKNKLIEILGYTKNLSIPDGGVLWLRNNITNCKYPLLISELKSQGTNCGRISLGENAQAVGNAIERLAKYYATFDTLYSQDTIFPFIAFVFGDDFILTDGELSHFMDNKMREINGQFEYNKLVTSSVAKERQDLIKRKGFSLMIKQDSWNLNEIFNYLNIIGKDSLLYYLKLDNPTLDVKEF